MAARPAVGNRLAEPVLKAGTVSAPVVAVRLSVCTSAMLARRIKLDGAEMAGALLRA